MDSTIIIPASKNELLYFYNEIILFYEKELKNQKVSFDLKRNNFSEFLRTSDTHFQYIRSNQITAPANYQKEPSSFIVFKQARKYTRFMSFMYHVRNCFAHGHFSKIRIGKIVYICMEDYNSRNNCSMVAQIPIKILPKIIDQIKNSQVKNPQ